MIFLVYFRPYACKFVWVRSHLSLGEQWQSLENLANYCSFQTIDNLLTMEEYSRKLQTSIRTAISSFIYLQNISEDSISESDSNPMSAVVKQICFCFDLYHMHSKITSKQRFYYFTLNCYV